MIRPFTLFWAELDTPFWLWFWDCIMSLYDHSLLFFLSFVFMWVCYLYFLNEVTWMTVALGRWISVHEYKNIYDYKFCFKVTKNKESGEFKFIHKWVPLTKFILNLFDILIWRHNLTKKESDKEEPNLTDISMTSLDMT